MGISAGLCIRGRRGWGFIIIFVSLSWKISSVFKIEMSDFVILDLKLRQEFEIKNDGSFEQSRAILCELGTTQMMKTLLVVKPKKISN